MRQNWSRSDRAITAAATALAAVPLLLPAVPPLQDLPGHMASYYIALDIDNVPGLQKYFSFDWHIIGNLGVDILVMPLGQLLGTELATKIIAILIPAITALAFMLVAHQAHGRIPVTSLLAVPLVYNYPFLYGFINYSLSSALAFLALALWIKWPLERFTVLRILTFALLSIICWFSHAIGWLIMGTSIGVAEFHRRFAIKENLVGAFIRTIGVCLPLLLPIILMLFGPTTAGGFTTSGMVDLKWSAKWILFLYRDRWMWFDLLCLLIAAIVAGMAILRILGLTINPKLALPSLALFLLFIIVPESVNRSSYVGLRIIPYAAALMLLAISVERSSTRTHSALTFLSVGFLLVKVAALTASFNMYDRDYREQLVALNFIPKGGRVAAFSDVPCESGLQNWYNPRTSHLSGLAVVRKDAFVNTTWSIPGLQLLRVHYPDAGAFASDPSGLVYSPGCKADWQLTMREALATVPLGAFDRLWLLHVPRDRWPTDPRLNMIWSHGDSVMYAVAATGEKLRP